MKDGTYQILHVEDEKNRFVNYSHMISAALNEDHISHQIYWAPSTAEAITFILDNGSTLDLILLDISLNGSDSETGLALVKRIRDKPLYSTVPIFVVSANVDRYRETLEELKRMQSIVGYSEPIGTVWTSLLRSILERKEVSLLHLSDIHEGKFFAFRDLVVTKSAIINDLCQQLGKIDFVVISGDISSVNDASDYRNAQKLLDSLKRKLNLSAGNFVFVPGNHDRDKSRTDSYVFSNFLHFLKTFYEEDEVASSDFRYPDLDLQDYDNPQNVFDRFFSIALFPEVKSIVVGFNSVNPLDIQVNNDISCNLQNQNTGCGLIRGGEISSNQIANLREELEVIFRRRPDVREYAKIAAFHHNVFEPSHVQAAKWRPTLINEGNLLAFLSDYGFQFILHGHLHYAENYYFRIYSKRKGINIISTGTFSGKNRDLDSNFCANKITYYVDASGTISFPKLHRYTIPKDGLQWMSSEVIMDL